MLRKSQSSKAASGTRPLTSTPAASPTRRGSWPGSKREANVLPDACRTFDPSRRFSAPATKQERMLAEVPAINLAEFVTGRHEVHGTRGASSPHRGARGEFPIHEDHAYIHAVSERRL